MGVENSSFNFGIMKKGKLNQITDVPGVSVAHVTKSDGNINTGVTAIIPHSGNLFQKKLCAAVHVINGFGKSAGLIQVAELGNIETPILLTNTLSVGTCINALIKYMLKDNPDIGTTTGTVNSVVMECNDAYLNDIRGMHISEEDALMALNLASQKYSKTKAPKQNDFSFDEGAVGAGRGMSCYGLKGGIGSASRLINIDKKEFTLGTLLLTNFGSKKDLVINGQYVGKSLLQKELQNKNTTTEPDKGSVITIIATDVPLDSRQLLRVAKRAQNGLARTGTITGNGSGEIVLAFSTANVLSHYSENKILQYSCLHDSAIDEVFRAAAECVEESVVSSLLHAEKVTGIEGHYREALKDLIAI